MDNNEQLAEALRRFNEHQQDLMQRHNFQDQPEIQREPPTSRPILSEQEANENLDQTMRPEIEHFQKLHKLLNNK